MGGPIKVSSASAEILHARLAAERGVAVRLQERLLNAVGEAVIATDTEDFITFWNSAAESLYGWTADEAIGEA